jgi:transcriptional regulator with PAS, ATPase and Fis domain
MTSNPSQTTRPTHRDSDLAPLETSGVFRVDPDRKILQWSQGMEELTGFSADEVLGMPCFVGIRCSACLSGCGVFDHGEVQDVPLVIFDRAGNEIRIRKSGSVIRDEQNQAIEAVETVTLQQMKRGATEDQLDRLLGSLGRLWIQADANLEILSLSSEIAEMTGIPEHRFVGMPLEDLLGSRLFGKESFFRREIVAGQHRENLSASLPSSNGREILVRVEAGRLADEKTPARYFVLLRGEEDHPAGKILPPEEASSNPRLSPAEQSEAQLILEALRASGFHRAEAADRLGMSRTTLWRKMNRYQL